MPILSFRGSRDKAPRPLTVDDAAAILAERKAHADTARAECDAKRATYNAALGEASLAGPNLDTPDVERAHRELTRAIDRHERAQEAARIAEGEHAAAVADAARRDADAQWDELERLTAVRAQTAKKFADLAAKLAAARDEFLHAAQATRAALPSRARGGAHFALFTEVAACDCARWEMERVGLLPDPRRAYGFAAAKPLIETSAELVTLAKRGRELLEDTPAEPPSADRAAVRPVPSPEDVDRQPERAA